MTKVAPTGFVTPLEVESDDERTAGGSRSPRGVAAYDRVEKWTRRYVTTLVVEDALCALAAVAFGWALRLRGPADTLFFQTYLGISVAVVAGWLFCLHRVGAYDLRQVGTGTQEVRQILRAALRLAGLLAIVAYLTQILVARTFVAIVIPIGAVLQMLLRYAVRHGVYKRRGRGEWTQSILAVGTRESVVHLIDATQRNLTAGLKVVAVCVEDAEQGTDIVAGIPIVGHVRQAAQVAAHVDADIVAVAGSGMGPRAIRELGWELEGTGRKMVMAPGLTEVAGPRVHMSPVEGLPLVWVDQPQFTGVSRVAKRAMDVAGAGLLLVVLSPFLALIAAVIRLTSRGPALYRSVRTGTDEKPITVYKFRSMYVDAEARRAELLDRNEFDGGILFKMREDPRVTRFGRILRKFSLDELPQLFNVLGGSMSLVGPRPPLPDEVEQYHDHVRRRLLVKPGMTGLWQVSGRSDLSWDEAVRLDLFYVENWSLSLDVAIIVRTTWTVLRGHGAY